MRAATAITFALAIGASIGSSGVAAQGSIVPAVAPDTIPTNLDELASFVDAGGGALVSTTVLTVLFEPSATQTERQAAVESIGGMVIGGVRAALDGIYLVRVPGDGSIETIMRLSRAFELLTAVAICSPYWAGGIGTF